MNAMLVLGIVFGFGFGVAVAFLVAARVKDKAIEDLKRRLKIGLGKIVEDAKNSQSKELWLFGVKVERWIPRRGRCWPPGNWPDPPPSMRPKQRDFEVVAYWLPSSGGVERPRMWSSPPSCGCRKTK